MFELMRELYPICRSITGNGVRQTLAILEQTLPIETHEVRSGTKVLDWTVPQEWNIRDAFVADMSGRKIVDYQDHNLHVVNYSRPIDEDITREELFSHLHTLADHPDWIPYRTTYYDDTWGFCLRHRDLQHFSDDQYRVCIDASLEDGGLTYGELLLPGETDNEVLIYTHTSHPSLANDNLSGIVVSAFLAQCLAETPRRFSYRFVWGPGTIGSITWLARNEPNLARIKHGLVPVLLGNNGGFTYKKSRRENAEIDEIASYVMKQRGGRTIAFDPYGYDERQFCSPGFNLPVGRITRTPHGEYPEYHSSADNLDFVQPEYLAESLDVCLEIVGIIEKDRRYLNVQSKGEPQLGRRGLYRDSGGSELPDREHAMLWILNQSDGSNSLLDIANKAGLPFQRILDASDELLDAGLLKPVDDD